MRLLIIFSCFWYVSRQLIWHKTSTVCDAFLMQYAAYLVRRLYSCIFFKNVEKHSDFFARPALTIFLYELTQEFISFRTREKMECFKILFCRRVRTRMLLDFNWAIRIVFTVCCNLLILSAVVLPTSPLPLISNNDRSVPDTFPHCSFSTERKPPSISPSAMDSVSAFDPLATTLPFARAPIKTEIIGWKSDSSPMSQQWTTLASFSNNVGLHSYFSPLAELSIFCTY